MQPELRTWLVENGFDPNHQELSTMHTKADLKAHSKYELKMKLGSTAGARLYKLAHKSKPLARKTSRFGGGKPCLECGKNVFATEELKFDGGTYHTACFFCDKCDKKIDGVTQAKGLDGQVFHKACLNTTQALNQGGVVRGRSVSGAHAALAARARRSMINQKKMSPLKVETIKVDESKSYDWDDLDLSPEIDSPRGLASLPTKEPGSRKTVTWSAETSQSRQWTPTNSSNGVHVPPSPLRGAMQPLRTVTPSSPRLHEVGARYTADTSVEEIRLVDLDPANDLVLSDISETPSRGPDSCFALSLRSASTGKPVVLLLDKGGKVVHPALRRQLRGGDGTDGLEHTDETFVGIAINDVRERDALERLDEFVTKQVVKARHVPSMPEPILAHQGPGGKLQQKIVCMLTRDLVPQGSVWPASLQLRFNEQKSARSGTVNMGVEEPAAQLSVVVDSGAVILSKTSLSSHRYWHQARVSIPYVLIRPDASFGLSTHAHVLHVAKTEKQQAVSSSPGDIVQKAAYKAFLTTYSHTKAFVLLGCDVIPAKGKWDPALVQHFQWWAGGSLGAEPVVDWTSVAGEQAMVENATAAAMIAAPTLVTVFSVRGQIFRPAVYVKLKLGAVKQKTAPTERTGVEQVYKYNNAFAFKQWPRDQKLHIALWEKKIVGKNNFLADIYVKRPETEVQRVYKMRSVDADTDVSVAVKLFPGPEEAYVVPSSPAGKRSPSPSRSRSISPAPMDDTHKRFGRTSPRLSVVPAKQPKGASIKRSKSVMSTGSEKGLLSPPIMLDLTKTRKNSKEDWKQNRRTSCQSRDMDVEVVRMQTKQKERERIAKARSERNLRKARSLEELPRRAEAPPPSHDFAVGDSSSSDDDEPPPPPPDMEDAVFEDNVVGQQGWDEHVHIMTPPPPGEVDPKKRAEKRERRRQRSLGEGAPTLREMALQDELDAFVVVSERQQKIWHAKKKALERQLAELKEDEQAQHEARIRAEEALQAYQANAASGGGGGSGAVFDGGGGSGGGGRGGGGDATQLFLVIQKRGCPALDTYLLIEPEHTLQWVFDQLTARGVLPNPCRFLHHTTSIPPSLYPLILASALLPLFTIDDGSMDVTEAQPQQPQQQQSSPKARPAARVFREEAGFNGARPVSPIRRTAGSGRSTATRRKLFEGK